MYAPARTGSRRRTVVLVVVGVLAAAVLGVAAVVAVVLLREAAWRAPEFPSLAAEPDPSLHGTVAYLNDATGCVDVVAAAGQPSKEVLCLPDEEVAKSKALGKPQGPQLVFLEDGRLEITMFRMTDPPGPSFLPGWQKVVDVRTGEVEDVPDADAPGVANRGTHPTTNARGEEVLRVDVGDRVELAVRTESGTRTLLQLDNIPPGAYSLPAAFWAPGGDWIAADDGRILVVTPGEPQEIRVLTDASDQRQFDGELARFAVTELDLLGDEQ